MLCNALLPNHIEKINTHHFSTVSMSFRLVHETILCTNRHIIENRTFPNILKSTFVRDSSDDVVISLAAESTSPTTA